MGGLVAEFIIKGLLGLAKAVIMPLLWMKAGADRARRKAAEGSLQRIEDGHEIDENIARLGDDRLRDRMRDDGDFRVR